MSPVFDTSIPIVDVLTLIATALIAVWTYLISRQANRIAARAVEVEADRMLLDWAADTIDAMARATALRLRDEKAIDRDDFHAERRALRARLVAAHHTGRLFLSETDGRPHAAIAALEEAAAFLDGRSFRSPRAEDWHTTRKAQVATLRTLTHRFTHAVQASVGDAWLHK